MWYRLKEEGGKKATKQSNTAASSFPGITVPKAQKYSSSAQAPTEV